jgi:hypothetical protein
MNLNDIYKVLCYTVNFQFNVDFRYKINAVLLLSACFSEVRGKMCTAP